MKLKCLRFDTVLERLIDHADGPLTLSVHSVNQKHKIIPHNVRPVLSRQLPAPCHHLGRPEAHLCCRNRHPLAAEVDSFLCHRKNSSGSGPEAQPAKFRHMRCTGQSALLESGQFGHFQQDAVRVVPHSNGDGSCVSPAGGASGASDHADADS